METKNKAVYDLGEVEDFLDYLNENKLEVLERRKKIPALEFWGNAKDIGPIRGSYRNLIYNEYRSIAILYPISLWGTFHHQVLDSCRKIVELLVRYQLGTPLTDDFYGISRINSLPWTIEEKKLAKRLYGLTSLSVHLRIMQLWEHTRPYSKTDYEEIRRQLLKTSSEKDINRIIEQWRGIDGMEGFVHEIVIKTVNLSNKVIK